MVRLIYIAIGGALGALFRYGLSGIISKSFDGVFPWGTLGVNLIGSFAIGVVWEFFSRAAIAPNVRSFVFIGLLGAFTTFSTYTLESMELMQTGEFRMATLNFLLSNGLGILLVFAGLESARIVLALTK